MNRRTFLKRIILYTSGIVFFKESSFGKIAIPAANIIPNVVRVHHAHATNWDFNRSNIRGSRYWEHVRIGVCREMIARGLQAFSRKNTIAEAWNWIFHQNGGNGYTESQNIAIKLNWNDCHPGLGDGPNGNYLVSNTQLVRAVIESLLSGVPGLKPENILVGDPSRTPYGRIRVSLSRLGVQVIEFKPDIFTASPEALVSYPDGKGDYVSEPMFGHSAHLIEMPILKAISPAWGISGALKDAHGKVGLANASYGENRKLWTSKHKNTFSGVDGSNTLVHMNSHPWIKNKRRLIIADGLYGLYNGQHFRTGHHNDDIPRPWILFNKASPNSILFSIDPVAIDCVMHDLVRFERIHQGLKGPFKKPIQLACAAAGLGINDDPIESEVSPSPIGPGFRYSHINYRVINAAHRRLGLSEQVEL